MFASLLAQVAALALITGFSASAALLRPGELIHVADGEMRDAALIGRMGVLDYASSFSLGQVLLLTNGTLAISSPNPPVTNDIAALAYGPYFVWLIQNSGRAVRWGKTEYPGLTWTNIAQIDVRLTNSLGVTRDGLIIGDKVPSGIVNVRKAIWASRDYNWQDFGLAILNDGKLISWGSDRVPIPPGMANIVDVACGDGHILAVHSDGRISGWGRNDYGQATAPFTTNAATVFAQGNDSFAILQDGRFLQWGRFTVSGAGGWGYRATNLNRFRELRGISKIRDQVLIGDYPQAAPPVILTFDNQQYRRTGARIKLAAEVSGSLPLSFQWFRNGEPIPGQTNQVFTILRAVTAHTGQYSLSVSNQFGVAQSQESRLEIGADQEPEIQVWVTNGAADGPGSLSEAIRKTTTAEKPIGIDYLGDIYCSSPHLIASSGRIIGVSPGYVQLKNEQTADRTNRIFNVTKGSSLSLEQIALSFGRAPVGGAILNEGTLKVEGCVFRQNRSTSHGGAIFNSGDLSISHTRFEQNLSYAAYSSSPDSPPVSGGAIASAGGSVTILASEFIGNSAYAEDASHGEAYSGFGGAIAISNSIARITSTLFLTNFARGGAGGPGIYGSFYGVSPGWGGAGIGGGIFGTNSPLFVTNSTFVGNRTTATGRTSAGAAIFIGGESTSSVLFATIVSNVCSGPEQVLTNAAGITVEPSARASVSGSILAQNFAGNVVCHATKVASGGFNLVDQPTGWNPVQTDVVADPLLLPLAQNGGPTRTILPSWASPAIDNGLPNFLISIDQRGFARPSGSAPDIGAVELQQGPPVILSQTESQSIPIGAEINLHALAVGPLPLSYQWLFNDVPVAGETNSSLRLASFTMQQEGTYRADVSNRYGLITSDPIELEAFAAPGFTRTLTNRIVAPGEIVVFQVVPTGQEPFRYSWYHNDQPIPNAANSTLILTNVNRAEAGNYRVRVENALGTGESVAHLSFWPVLEVVSLADRGPGSLREAIELASQTPEAQHREIVLGTNGVIRLESTLPTITTSLQIAGTSAFQTIIDGQQSNSVVFVTSSGKLSLEALTIRGGSAKVNQNGGGIRNEGTLFMERCMVISNKTQGGFGGGIANKGTLVVNSSSFIGNSAVGGSSDLGGAGAGLGGALFNEGSLFVTNSTFSDNRAVGGSALAVGYADSGKGGGPEGGAAGMRGYSGTVDGPGSLPGIGGFGSGGGQGAGHNYNNTSYTPFDGGNGGFGGGGGAGGYGSVSPEGPWDAAAGGLGGYGGGRGMTCMTTNYLTNGTFIFTQYKFAVTAGGGGGLGGAIFVKSGDTTIVNCTIAQNEARGGTGSRGYNQPECIGGAGSGLAAGIFNYQGTVLLKNSIVASNVAQTQNADVEGAIQSNGHNLIQSFAPASGLLEEDILAGPLGLKPLADNGGGTLTYAINTGSPALRRGVVETPFDQRGVIRYEISDIGAYQTEFVRVLRVAAEGGVLTLDLDIPAGRRPKIQSAASIEGPWFDILPVPVGESIQVSVRVSGTTGFVRVLSE